MLLKKISTSVEMTVWRHRIIIDTRLHGYDIAPYSHEGGNLQFWLNSMVGEIKKKITYKTTPLPLK